MRTLILGLGNPLLGDDGVGWHVIAALRHLLAEAPAAPELDCHAGGGLSLMERLVGYQRAIVIDALATGGPPGGVTCQPLAALASLAGSHLASPHETSLQAALEIGRALQLALPSAVTVIGIEAAVNPEFSDCLSPAVEQAVPAAAHLALRQLKE